MKEKGCEEGYNMWDKGREEGDEGKWMQGRELWMKRMQEGDCG